MSGCDYLSLCLFVSVVLLHTLGDDPGDYCRLLLLHPLVETARSIARSSGRIGTRSTTPPRYLAGHLKPELNPSLHHVAFVIAACVLPGFLPSSLQTHQLHLYDPLSPLGCSEMEIYDHLMAPFVHYYPFIQPVLGNSTSIVGHCGLSHLRHKECHKCTTYTNHCALRLCIYCLLLLFRPIVSDHLWAHFPFIMKSGDLALSRSYEKPTITSGGDR